MQMCVFEFSNRKKLYPDIFIDAYERFWRLRCVCLKEKKEKKEIQKEKFRKENDKPSERDWLIDWF